MNASIVKKLIVALAFVVVAAIIYKMVTFDLFDEDMPIEIVSLETKGQGDSIGIYYVPANATRNDYIQLRRVDMKNKIEVLESYERYQQVFDYRQMNDSVLRLILRDTSSYRTRQDTFWVKTKNR